MKAIELRKIFANQSEKFADCFNFYDDCASVCTPAGLLSDESLDIDEETGKISISMTGDTSYYDTVENAVEQLYAWYSENLLGVVSDELEGGEMVDATHDRNGYPSNLQDAVIGGSYEELREIADKYNGRLVVVSLRKRNGWNVWAIDGRAFEDYTLTADDFGADKMQFQNEGPRGLLNLLEGIEEEGARETISNNYNACLSLLDKVDDRKEMVICNPDYSEAEIVTRVCSSYESDATRYALALIEDK